MSGEAENPADPRPDAEFLNRVRDAARQRIVYTQHALDEMHAEAEIVSPAEVRTVVFEGEIIEDYPEDVRGHSCLMLARTDQNRPVHVVCAPKADYLGIITVYVPTLDRWEDDFRIRKRKET